jgi:hypothetical protein
LRRSVIVALLTLATPHLAAQAQRIEVSTNVHVSQSRERSPYQEVVIASDPADLTRLIACTMLEPGPNRSVKSAVFSSFDGGASWASRWSPPLTGRTTPHAHTDLAALPISFTK